MGSSQTRPTLTEQGECVFMMGQGRSHSSIWPRFHAFKSPSKRQACVWKHEFLNDKRAQVLFFKPEDCRREKVAPFRKECVEQQIYLESLSETDDITSQKITSCLCVCFCYQNPSSTHKVRTFLGNEDILFGWPNFRVLIEGQDLVWRSGLMVTFTLKLMKVLTKREMYKYVCVRQKETERETWSVCDRENTWVEQVVFFHLWQSEQRRCQNREMDDYSRALQFNCVCVCVPMSAKAVELVLSWCSLRRQRLLSISRRREERSENPVKASSCTWKRNRHTSKAGMKCSSAQEWQLEAALAPFTASQQKQHMNIRMWAFQQKEHFC